MKAPVRITLFVALLSCAGVMFFASQRTGGAVAATITVTSTGDFPSSCPGPNCTLRSALGAAGNGTTIDFAVTGTITLSNTPLTVATNVTIMGPGANVLTVNGGNQFNRVFVVNSGTVVTISGLTITGGSTRTGTSSSSTTAGDCDGVGSVCGPVVGGNDLPIAGGAGIYNQGNLTLRKCEVSGNETGGGSNDTNIVNGGNGSNGGVGGTATSTPPRSGANGGGIYNDGTLIIEESTISNNKTGGGAPANANGGNGTSGGTGGAETITAGNGGHGAGIYNAGTLNVNFSTVSGNTTGNGGGATATGGNGSNGGTGGKATVTGGNAGDGGGIYNANVLVVNNSTISGNHVGKGGSTNAFGGDGTSGGTGGEATVTGGEAGHGVGIYNGANLTINNSTFSDNMGGELGRSDATAGDGDGSGSTGGNAMGTSQSDEGGNAIASESALTINNSTIAFNVGFGSCTGSTIIGGSATNGGAGGNASGSTQCADPAAILISAGTFDLNSSIVANNAGSDVFAAATTGDYNLIGSTNSSFTGTNNIFGVDPMLGPLVDNGGPTFTRKLMTNSPAIDKGKNALGFTTDQRGAGYARTFNDASVNDASGGDGTDIGAFEVQNVPTLANPNFEIGPFSTNGTVTGWTVSAHVADNTQGGTTATHSAALSAGGNFSGDTLAQDFSTITGQMYTLDFDAGIFGVRSGAPLQVKVEVIGGGTVLNQLVTPPEKGTFDPNQVTFQHYHFPFTANSGTSTLKFTAVGTGNASADQEIDTVVVSLAPPPSTTPTPTPTPPPGPAPTLNNPNFEVGPFNTNHVVTGWTVVGNVGDNSEGSTSSSHSAAFSAGANSQGDMLSQSFTTTNGQTYAIDFDAGIFGVRSGSPLQLRVEVLGAGTLVNQVITPPEAGTYNPAQVQFQHYHFIFTANGASTTLRFTSIGLGNGGADQVVDTVSISVLTASNPTLVNGDFETGPFMTNGIVTGWAVGGNMHVADNSEGATSFSHGAALSAGANSEQDTLAQQFSTVNGQMYAVDFDAGIFGQRSGAPLQLRVEIIGTGTIIDQTVTPPEAGTYNPAAVQFQHYHITFTANSATTVLRFTSKGLGNGGADQIVDTVKITAIP